MSLPHYLPAQEAASFEEAMLISGLKVKIPTEDGKHERVVFNDGSDQHSKYRAFLHAWTKPQWRNAMKLNVMCLGARPTLGNCWLYFGWGRKGKLHLKPKDEEDRRGRSPQRRRGRQDR